jgi:hypothetical protein
VLHFSVHSFTPRLRGDVRHTDIGLLFDPSRAAEERFCRALRAELRREFADLRIDMNEPYSGVSDGLTSTLRGGAPALALPRDRVRGEPALRARRPGALEGARRRHRPRPGGRQGLAGLIRRIPGGGNRRSA